MVRVAGAVGAAGRAGVSGGSSLGTPCSMAKQSRESERLKRIDAPSENERAEVRGFPSAGGSEWKDLARVVAHEHEANGAEQCEEREQASFARRRTERNDDGTSSLCESVERRTPCIWIYLGEQADPRSPRSERASRKVSGTCLSSQRDERCTTFLVRPWVVHEGYSQSS